MVKEYNKIGVIFNRDVDGTKKLIDGDFKSETVEYLKNNIWTFTEKIDGTNIRVYWDGHKVQFFGRTDRANIPSHLVNYLNETFGTMEAEELFEQKFGEDEVTLYGEGYGYKIQNGGLYRDDVSFIMFDVMIGNVWLKREDIEDIAKAFGVDCVPIIMQGTIDEAVNFVKSKPMSTIGKAPMKGLVGKPMFELYDRLGNRIITKIKVKDFF